MPLNIVRDDLANARADAIVIPANEQLAIGGGAGEAVARKAGAFRVKRACRKIGGCPTGSAVSTPAFSFPARYLIHAVGPIWQGTPDDALKLRCAYDTGLELAHNLGCESVALPLLSAGSFGCPAHISLSIALASIEDALAHTDLIITLVLFDKRAVRASLDFLGEIESRIDDAYADNFTISDRATAMFAHPLGTSAQMAGAQPAGASRTETQPARASQTGALPTKAMRAEADLTPTPRATSTRVPQTVQTSLPQAASAPNATSPCFDALEDRLGNLERGFSETLLALIDASGKTDAEVYRRANITRQHFSKIRNNVGYRPTKPTVLALCVALELDLAQTHDLLERAGFALTRANKFDIILEYFIENGIYDAFRINETLFYFDQPLIGG